MAHETDLWFGNVTHAQWVQSFLTGFADSAEGFSDEIEFDNGGIWVEQSAATHKSYNLSFLTAVDEYEGVEAFARFASGEYGTDYLRFVSPAYQRTNLFNMPWAAPGLIDSGWKNHGGNTPTFTATGANSYGKPLTKATWAIDTDANAVFGKAFTFLIPPGHTLHLGGCGSVTGTGAMRVLPIGGAAATITLAADASAPAFTNTVSGDTAASATVYMTRTSSATSTITCTAMWAQILPTGESPSIPRHFPGQGSMGLRFRGHFSQEPFIPTSGAALLSVSGRLVEVEPWE